MPGVVALEVVAVFWLPGGLVLTVLGRRGLARAALAPVVTMGLLGAGAVVADPLGLRWTVPTVLGIVAMAAGVAALLRRWAPDAPAEPSGSTAVRRWLGGAIAAGVALHLVPLAIGAGRADRLLDGFDAVGHLNALRYIAETGSASSFALPGVNGADVTGFDGAGWHAVASLVPPWPDAATVFNAAVLVPMVLAWVLGLVHLTRTLLPGRPWAAVLAAPLSAAGVVAPYYLALIRAGLVPNAVALSLVPAVLACLAEPGWPRSPTRAAACALAVVGLGVTHPAAALALALLAVPLAVVRTAPARARLARTQRGRLTMIVAAGAGAALLLLLFLNERMVGVLTYEPSPPRPLLTTLGHVLTGSAAIAPLTTGLVTVALAGLGALLARRLPARWFVGAAALVVVFLVVSASGLPILGDLDRPWYGEPRRLAPLVAVVAVPLAGLGLDSLLRYLAARTVLPAGWTRRRALGGLTAAVLLLAVAPAVTGPAGSAHDAFGATESTYATDDEVAMMRRLRHTLDPERAVLGSPHSGAAHLYGLLGQEVVVRTTFSPETPDVRYLGEHLDELGTNPALCGPLERLDVAYLYVDPVLFRVAGDLPTFADAPADGVRLLDSGGTAAVYEITACQRP